MIKKITLAVACIFFLSLENTANATVLTFDAGLSNYDNIPQGYGDNVTSTSMGAYSYGSAGGFTPNISVSYAGDYSPALSPPETHVTLWSTGFGDLINVANNESDGALGYSITLSAEPGYKVLLSSFDLGVYYSDTSVIPGLTITNGLGAVLHSETSFSLTDYERANHRQYIFATPLSASQITIHVNTTGLAGRSDNIGLDNITFSQTPVPVPAAFWLLGTGFLGFVGMRRTRRK